MGTAKDTRQATVRIGYDGRVHKTYHGKSALARFDNELAILRLLERNGCDFVPRVLESDRKNLLLVTTNCGKVVEKISQRKVEELFAALEQYGVRHEDRFDRNITYNPWQGQFNVIDFEFATDLASGRGLRLEDIEIERGAMGELEDLERLYREGGSGSE